MRSSPRMRSRALLVAALIVVGAASPAQTQERRPSREAAVSFWSTFGDPTLEALVARALRANPELRAAEARTESAQAQRRITALDLAPVVTATGGYSRQQLASASFPGPGGSLPDQELWDAGLRLSWDVDVFGRTRRTLEGRGALVDAAETDEEDARVLLAADVAAAYVELRGAQDRLAVARRNAENQRNTLQVTLDRLEGGSGTALDTERAQAQLSSTLAAIPLLETAAAAARNRIDALLGVAPGSTAIDPASASLQLPDTLVLSGTDAMVRSRPDVRSAERLLAASRAFVGAAKADYLPRISVQGVAGYTATAFDALGAGGTRRYAIGPVISWPLFDLGRVHAGVEAARAGEHEAEARYQQVVLNARAELETALVAYHRSTERVAHLEAAAAASERATELARLRFEEGASDFLQVLDAERTQLDAQDMLAVGRTAATSALVAVYRALGGQWPGQ